jgi:hypothetical protein
MAKRDLSRHQKGIVKRYYENRDTIMVTKLSELVSELYVCESEKKAAGLWKRVATALANTGVDKARAARIVESKDIKGLARVVGEMA